MSIDKKVVKTNPNEKNSLGFNIQITWWAQDTIDKNLGGYKEYCVAANNFIIAHFVDQVSMQSYISYLEKYNFNLFPKKILQILEGLSHSTK